MSKNTKHKLKTNIDLDRYEENIVNNRTDKLERYIRIWKWKRARKRCIPEEN